MLLFCRHIGMERISFQTKSPTAGNTFCELFRHVFRSEPDCRESSSSGSTLYTYDISDAELTEVITVNYYNADEEMTRTEYLVGGELSSYTEYYYEDVEVKSGSKCKFDFRDKDRKLDERAYIVY